MALFVFVGQLPSLNDVIDEAKKGRGHAYARLKKQLTNDIALRAKAQRVPRFDRARLRFAWVESGRHRDPDNIASAKKFLLDGLVLAGVLPGDGWAHVAGWTDTFEVGPRAGVEVTIEAA